MIPDGDLKTAALNVLVAKHEGNTEFTPITAESYGYKTCGVVEITPEKMTAKSDVGQDRRQNRFTAEHLAERGLPDDLETIREMGFTLEKDENKRYRLKE